MDDLIKLLSLCKCGIYLTVNEHRDYYQSAEEKLNEMHEREEDPDITDEVRKKIIETNNIIILQFYPNTPIGSFTVLHYDIREALKIALETF